MDGDEIQVKFWERHGDFGEPDLIVLGRDWAIVVEVKLGAEVSGQDQLRKYYDLLEARYSGKANRHVIYLTKDLTSPVLDAGITRGIEKNLWWVSWYELSQVLEQHDGKDPVAQEMVSDLRRFIDHSGLALYQGLRLPEITIQAPLFWDDTTPLLAQHDAWTSGRIFWQEAQR